MNYFHFVDIPIQIVNGTHQMIIRVNDPLTELGVLLVATTIGAFLGFISTILIDRYKKQQDLLADKINLIDLLYTEIRKIKADAENPNNGMVDIEWDELNNEFKGNYGLASLPVLSSSINSGHFLLLSSDLQSTLSTVNDRIQHYNWFIKQMLTFYMSPVYTNPILAKREATKLIISVKKIQKTLLESFQKTITGLENERYKTKVDRPVDNNH